MQLCTFESAGSRRLGVLVGDGRVVDAHLTAVASMADHLTPKRAREIARSLVPPTLMGLLLNGRHGFNAIHDSLGRLGPSVAHDPELSFALADVELLPAHPAEATAADDGGWQSIPFADEGDGDESFELRVLHTTGGSYDRELFGIVGAKGDVVLVSAGSSGVLQTIDEPVPDDLRTALDQAVEELRAASSLHVGDVVRVGVRERARQPEIIDLTTELLEALLTKPL